MIYRNELKFICDMRDNAILESRLSQLMKLDQNSNEHHKYLIKSIYFDDFYNSGMHENEDGVNERSKYRIRAYNNDPNYIKMEIKSKLNSLGRKETNLISHSQYEQIVLNNNYAFDSSMPNVYNRFCLLAKTRLLRPVCTIGYERTAYTLREGNVRITFDENLFASTDFYNFWNNEQKIPLLSPGQFILEIKYDQFLPKHIQQAVGIKNLNQSAFSKYYIGRCALRNAPLSHSFKELPYVYQ